MDISFDKPLCVVGTSLFDGFKFDTTLARGSLDHDRPIDSYDKIPLGQPHSTAFYASTIRRPPFQRITLTHHQKGVLPDSHLQSCQ